MLDPAIAARLASLEALVSSQQAAIETSRVALEAERARRLDAESERDRLREAYQALQLEVELARRRLVVAKAERVDTTQLELEFAAKLAALDAFAGATTDDEIKDAGNCSSSSRRRRSTGRRDLRQAPIGEERLEITDPDLEGVVDRIGAEESCELVWRRGGFVRLVIARIKYRATATETAAASSAAQESDAMTGDPDATSESTAADSEAAPPSSDAATSSSSAVVSDEIVRTTIVTAPMPERP